MKKVLITGASGGVGSNLARAFSLAGHKLILHSCSNEVPIFTQHTRVKGDFTDDEVIYKLANIAREHDIDILINAAGIYANKLITEINEIDIKNILSVNLFSTILLTRLIWPIFQKKQSGIIVNINSIAGKYGSYGESIYSAAKHGLDGFAKSLQFEAKRENIRIINIFSGAIKTDMTIDRGAQDNFINPADLADFILKLCESEYDSMNITDVEIRRRNY